MIIVTFLVLVIVFVIVIASDTHIFIVIVIAIAMTMVSYNSFNQSLIKHYSSKLVDQGNRRVLHWPG